MHTATMASIAMLAIVHSAIVCNPSSVGYVQLFTVPQPSARSALPALASFQLCSTLSTAASSRLPSHISTSSLNTHLHIHCCSPLVLRLYHCYDVLTALCIHLALSSPLSTSTLRPSSLYRSMSITFAASQRSLHPLRRYTAHQLRCLSQSSTRHGLRQARHNSQPLHLSHSFSSSSSHPFLSLSSALSSPPFSLHFDSSPLPSSSLSFPSFLRPSSLFLNSSDSSAPSDSSDSAPPSSSSSPADDGSSSSAQGDDDNAEDDDDSAEMKDDEDADEDVEAEDDDDVDDAPHSRNISDSSSRPNPQAMRRHYNVLYAGGRGGVGGGFKGQWPDDIHALRAVPYNGTASSTVPRLPVLPLVPVSTRPGLPGSIFRWQLDLDNSYIRRVLERQLKEGSPYIGLFLYRKPGDPELTIKKPTQAQVDAATAAAHKTKRQRGKEQVKAAAEMEEWSSEKVEDMLRRGREGSIGRAEWLKAINLQGDRIAEEVSRARTRLMTLRQERDEVLHALVVVMAGGDLAKSDAGQTPWMREMELESMQKRAAELHNEYMALHVSMKTLEDKMEDHKKEFDKVLEEGRTQPPLPSDDASASSSTPGLDIQELASALSSSGPKSSATQIQQSLKDYDEVNKVHRIGVLAEFRLNGDSVTIICHRRIEIKGLSPVSPNIIMVNVKHHDEVGPNISAASTSSPSTTSTPASSPSASATPSSSSTASPYSSEVAAYVSLIQDAATQLLGHEEIKKRSKSFTTPFIDPTIPGHLCDYVTSLIVSDADVLQDVLSTVELRERCYKVLQLTKNEQRTMAARKRIQEKVVVDPAYSKDWLREQKRNIERQLGGKDNRQATVDKFLARLEGKTVPADVQRVINEEVDKLSGSDNEGSEYSITRNYVDWLTSMPYSVYTKERRNIEEAEKILNEDHYGMEDVKQRILEFIAATTRAGKEAQQGKIICLTGPPGVGSAPSRFTQRTSLSLSPLFFHSFLLVLSMAAVVYRKTSIARSIAKALGREYSRFSVGGMDDVAEIKGHRRTYLGALPGKLISALKTHSSRATPSFSSMRSTKLGRGGSWGPQRCPPRSAGPRAELRPSSTTTSTSPWICLTFCSFVRPTTPPSSPPLWPIAWTSSLSPATCTPRRRRSSLSTSSLPPGSRAA